MFRSAMIILYVEQTCNSQGPGLHQTQNITALEKMKEATKSSYQISGLPGGALWDTIIYYDGVCGCAEVVFCATQGLDSIWIPPI